MEDEIYSEIWDAIHGHLEDTIIHQLENRIQEGTDNRENKIMEIKTKIIRRMMLPYKL